MKSWWELGEGAGFSGNKLSTYQIDCPFCEERDNFEEAAHFEKKKPNSSKVLNFDTLKCGNCAGYVMVLWSSSDYDFHSGIHDFRVLPWSLTINKAPTHWPQAIQRYWVQANKSLQVENWDAAAEMARSTLQIALRDHGAVGKDLFEEINNLAEKGVLPPLMKEWSHEVRELGNDSAHPRPEQKETSLGDARDIVEFLDFLLEYLYDLPKRIEDYRGRRKAEKATTQIKKKTN
ncbi:MAG: hypothetical protein A2172_01175 [Candidatus Woykebacteria bacterium RBG_13_40_15]|uniref:DUF4145 domain-containing protein n=1 Tax=Candidatus Woykebacteria bacterium RBG_13_40_15 TaxID=1802593 RepID=A0A1G1W8Y6_9BACT|nr:MAG: hypothetical protein A2172_01175 [Candidatus Woykebacteria bacterium RBG_13_40_15]